MRKFVSAFLMGTSALVMFQAPAAYAQTSAPGASSQKSAQDDATDDDSADKNKEIVVTGTQIRGVTPAGSTILATTKEVAEEQAVTNGNELLANTPTATNMFQSLPAQVGFAGGLVAVARLPTQGVSLRNLPGVNTGGSPTLTLIDGHRVVPSGTNVLGGQQVDNSSISAATIQRTEIMPDGASSVYGSDAVTGVINYITRDKYDGINLTARAGMAKGDAGKDYYQYDASLTVGKSWDDGRGNFYVSGSYAYHDPLWVKDRKYLATYDRNPDSPLFNTVTGLNCASPNIQVTVGANRRYYPMSGINGTILPYTTNGGIIGSGVSTSPAGPGGGNRCVSNPNNSVYPKERRYNINFGLSQEIAEGLTFMLKGSWSRRKSEATSHINFSPTVASTNVNYRPVCGGTSGNTCGATGFQTGDNTLTQTILTDMSATSLGGLFHSYVDLKTWQITPSLTWDIGGEWQARALFSYGKSDTQGIQGTFDATTAQARVTAGTINPYNLPGSAAGAFDNLITYGAQNGKFTLADAKVVADGPLPLRMPGGAIHAALGGEWSSLAVDQRFTGTVQSFTPSNFTWQNPIDGSTNFLHYNQKVTAAFAELNVPLIGEDNGVPLIRSLNLSGSARYDKYNDFGDTFNYMLGATMQITRMFTLRGNYNTSFSAPSNFQQLGKVTGAQVNNSNCNGPQGTAPCQLPSSQTNASGRLFFFQGYIPPGGANGGQAGATGLTQAQIVALGAANSTQPTGIALVMNTGTDPLLGPQEARSWSLGLDVTPPFIPGLSFGASYYNLLLKKAIGSPFTTAQGAFDNYPNVVTCHGGVKGFDAGAPAACAVPMSLAELAPYFTPVTSGGQALPSSLLTAGLGSGSGSNLLWSTVQANYCGPSGATNTGGTWNPAAPGLGCNAGSYSIFYIADNRTTNLGNVYATGLDMRFSYRTNVPWGQLDISGSGNINLSTYTQIADGRPKVSIQQFGSSNFRSTMSLGTTIGGFRAQLTWQHSAGFTINPTNVGTFGSATVAGTGAFGQTRVNAFDTFDSFFRYKFDNKDNLLLKGLALTLNVNNVFNTSPPRQGGTTTNGLTLGRTFIIGLNKEF